MGVPFPNIGRIVLPTNADEKKKFFGFIVDSYVKSFSDMKAISDKYGKPVIVAAEMPTPRGERDLGIDIMRLIAKQDMVCYSMPDEAAMVLNSMVKYGEFLRRG